MNGGINHISSHQRKPSVQRIHSKKKPVSIHGCLVYGQCLALTSIESAFESWVSCISRHRRAALSSWAHPNARMSAGINQRQNGAPSLPPKIKKPTDCNGKFRSNGPLKNFPNARELKEKGHNKRYCQVSNKLTVNNFTDFNDRQQTQIRSRFDPTRYNAYLLP